MIILMTNGGSWKKVSRRKKFKQEFGDEEEAFNDDFKIGLAFNFNAKTKACSLKLYESFYQSDIIVASPLAVRILTGQETEASEGMQKSRLDFDFLSSIEFLVMD